LCLLLGLELPANQIINNAISKAVTSSENDETVQGKKSFKFISLTYLGMAGQKLQFLQLLFKPIQVPVHRFVKTVIPSKNQFLSIFGSGSICRDISAILKINLAPAFLSKIFRSISRKNSAYRA
jgi:hypothetical protein